jgi:hypothetical protein
MHIAPLSSSYAMTVGRVVLGLHQHGPKPQLIEAETMQLAVLGCCNGCCNTSQCSLR